MKMVLGLLADAANTTGSGKLNVLGEFNVLWAPDFPFVLTQMVLVLRLEATAGEGSEHELGIRIVDEDGHNAGPTLDGKIDMGKPWRPGLPYRSQTILTFQGAVFPKAGTYTFEIIGDKQQIGVIQLHVRPASERPG